MDIKNNFNNISILCTFAIFGALLSELISSNVSTAILFSILGAILGYVSIVYDKPSPPTL